MSRPQLPCEDCDLNSIAQPDRRTRCVELARDILRQWWHNDPTVTLGDVAYDEMRGAALNATEEEAMYGCMAEHSSSRCDNMNPYGV